MYNGQQSRRLQRIFKSSIHAASSRIGACGALDGTAAMSRSWSMSLCWYFGCLCIGGGFDTHACLGVLSIHVQGIAPCWSRDSYILSIIGVTCQYAWVFVWDLVTPTFQQCITRGTACWSKDGYISSKSRWTYQYAGVCVWDLAVPALQSEWKSGTLYRHCLGRGMISAVPANIETEGHSLLADSVWLISIIER